MNMNQKASPRFETTEEDQETNRGGEANWGAGTNLTHHTSPISNDKISGERRRNRNWGTTTKNTKEEKKNSSYT